MIIGISGKIGSGKTTIADYLHDKYSFSILRFRDLIIQEIIKRGLEISRESMQNIGNEMYNNLGPSKFCKILFLDCSPQNDYTIDSIRHVEIYNYLKNKYKDSFLLIFMENEKISRFDRIRKRDKIKIENKRIQRIENHKVESETVLLSNLADYIILNTKDYKDLYRQIDIIFAKNRLTKCST